MSALLRLIALLAFGLALVLILRPGLLGPGGVPTTPPDRPASAPAKPDGAPPASPPIALSRITLPPISLPSWPRWPDLPPPPPLTSAVDHILIEKAARRMTVWQADGPPRVFTIALGKSPRGTKTRQGDNRTPEGLFRVDRRNASSAYHLSLGLDYPRPEDRARARRAGVDPGGDIMIHGQPNQLARDYLGGSWKIAGDWTAGCVALTNDEIRELFAHTAIGTEVEIRP